MFNFNEVITLPKKKIDLLTVGELIIDMISEEYDNFEGVNYKKFFGGSPANIAMNTKKLGINSIVAAAVGKDGLGDFLLKHIERNGINTSCIQKLEYSTSLVLVTKSKSTPIPIFYRSADYQLEYSPELKAALKDSGIVHFSCWPLSYYPARNTMESIINDAKSQGILVCFDPNYHPMIWQKGEDGIGYIKKLIGMVDIIKPSKDDAERIFGNASDEDHLEEFLKLGAKLVIMTLGKDGAIVSNGKETLRFSSMAEEIVDTTGAGDAFWSGFYAAIAKGYTIKDALNLGFAVSAYKLKHSGAVVELPALEKIKEIYNL